MTLDDALDAYWAAAYAEGQRGATHDTEDGLAQTALSAVLSCVRIGIAAERERMEAKHKGLLAMQALINESRGVTGLHLNGDEADWAELRMGGRFEEWLLAFDEALAL